MSKWGERVDGHPAIASLRALSSSVDEVAIDADFTPSAIEDLERIRSVLKYAETVIDSVDPELLPPAILNGLASPLGNLSSEFSAFKSDRNFGHLQNANSHLDALLPALLYLPSPMPGEQVEGIRETVISFRRSAGQYISAVERERDSSLAEVNQLKSKLDGMSSEIATQKARLDEAISSYQNQFSQAESARREEFNKQQLEIVANAKSAQQEFAEELESALEDSRSELETIREQHKTEFATIKERTEASAAEHLEELRSFKLQAQNLLHVIGNTGMAGEFQKAANSAKRTVWLWQIIAVLSMLGLIGFAIGAYTSTVAGEVVWGVVGTRLFVAVTFGVLAAFSVRQIDRYFDAERRNRRYQLELSSIDPYLISLPPDKRDEIKLKLAEKLFGGAGATTEVHPLQRPDNASGTSSDLLRIALESLQDLIKKRT